MVRGTISLLQLLLAITSAQSQSTPTVSAAISEVTSCHTHGSKTFCIAPDGSEVQVTATGSATISAAPAEFTGCHSSGSDTHCLDPDGNEVQLVLDESHEEGEHGHGHDEGEGDHGNEGQNCHFHAGVEHCTKDGESESGSEPSCGRTEREYNIPLRVGTLFVILVTSAIAVFGPVAFTRIFSKSINGHIFTIIKQFGTGIMLATAFIHLFTHAHLMFNNPCLGPLAYEGTTAAIAMAGIFLTFLLEYLGNRMIIYKRARKHCHHHEGEDSSDESHTGGKDAETSPAPPPHQPTLASLGHHHHHVEDKLSVLVMEAGIIFHSVIIGLTLVVAGDSGYISLFIVIIFHQAFEGLALGSRIAELTETPLRTKLLMAGVFTFITPIGMAIGLGVIDEFNGNAKGTIIAIGTLDALSAGILAWAALVDMLSHDWLYGELKCASPMRTFVGMASLVAGMILMGLLGKWA